MATLINYRMPYEVAFHGVDLGSGKSISNILALRNDVIAVLPPAYGTPLAGSSLLVLATAMLTAGWRTLVLPVLSHNYQLIDMVIRSVLGYQYPTPSVTIANLGSISPIAVITGAPHGLTTGQSVRITGSNVTNNVNGEWVITVTSSTVFTLNGSGMSANVAPKGSYQLASGTIGLTYGDSLTLAGVIGTDVGLVAGDALPLFSTASIRKLTGQPGRSGRGKMSLSPMSESDGLDGTFSGAKRTALNAMGTGLIGAYNNGSTAGASSANSLLSIISLSRLIAAPVPVTSSEDWCFTITGMPSQPNMGSMVRRKPKLTAAIT